MFSVFPPELEFIAASSIGMIVVNDWLIRSLFLSITALVSGHYGNLLHNLLRKCTGYVGVICTGMLSLFL